MYTKELKNLGKRYTVHNSGSPQMWVARGRGMGAARPHEPRTGAGPRAWEGGRVM